MVGKDSNWVKNLEMVVGELKRIPPTLSLHHLLCPQPKKTNQPYIVGWKSNPQALIPSFQTSSLSEFRYRSLSARWGERKKASIQHAAYRTGLLQVRKHLLSTSKPGRDRLPLLSSKQHHIIPSSIVIYVVFNSNASSPPNPG